MPKPSYPLKKYIKAAEKLAKIKGFDRIEYEAATGSIIRFELFLPNESEPTSFWIIHHDHNGKKTIWSRDDYRKAADRMNATEDEFLDILRNM